MNFLKRLLFGKRPDIQFDSEFFVKPEYELKESNNAELVEYYKVLRDMLKNFNNMILTISIRGALLVLSIVAIPAYFPIDEGPFYQIISILLVIAALVICNNLKAQNDFFAGMLKHTVNVTKKVESLILSSVQDGRLYVPKEMLITYVLQRDFPGAKYVKKRQKFFPLIMAILVFYLVYLIGFLVYYLFFEEPAELDNTFKLIHS